MSLALTNGWSRALESFCKERFQQDVIPSVAREAMLGYCGRHYKANVHRVSRVSKFFIGTQKQEEFKALAVSLL